MVRPIDLQGAVPNSYEVGRMGSAEALRPELLQQQFSRQLNKEIRHDEQFVRESNKSEQSQIDKDGKNNRRNNGEESSRKKNNKNPAAAAALKEYKSTSMLDIRI